MTMYSRMLLMTAVLVSCGDFGHCFSCNIVLRETCSAPKTISHLSGSFFGRPFVCRPDFHIKFPSSSMDSSVVLNKREMESGTKEKRNGISCGFGRLVASMKNFQSTSKVLVLNASYEPLCVVTTRRALSMIWTDKACLVVARGVARSSGGLVVDIPSVVSLRRYITSRPKMLSLNRKRTVMLRDEGVCQYCGKKAENMDHVIPRCRGGAHSWDNVVASCAPCNTRKGSHLLKDLNMKLRKLPTPPRHLSWVRSFVWKVDPAWKPFIGEASDYDTMIGDDEAAAAGSTNSKGSRSGTGRQSKAAGTGRQSKAAAEAATAAMAMYSQLKQ